MFFNLLHPDYFHLQLCRCGLDAQNKGQQRYLEYVYCHSHIFQHLLLIGRWLHNDRHQPQWHFNQTTGASTHSASEQHVIFDDVHFAESQVSFSACFLKMDTDIRWGWCLQFYRLDFDLFPSYLYRRVSGSILCCLKADETASLTCLKFLSAILAIENGEMIANGCSYSSPAISALESLPRDNGEPVYLNFEIMLAPGRFFDLCSRFFNLKKYFRNLGRSEFNHLRLEA